MNLTLATPTSSAWVENIVTNFDEFLLDHAANERKAAMMAMSLVAHYPDRLELMEAMIDLALEELNHFRQVVRIVNQRGLVLTADEKDPYVNQLRHHFRKGSEHYFLDRLLSAAVIEARGAERFSLVAQAVSDAQLTTFYSTLAKSEEKHHQLFLDQASIYFDTESILDRLDEWLEIEKRIVEQLPIHPRLH
ncbi:MAG TPA: tRNA-(ms[2]io[6]A)-hydroxylase [Gammaproteobacteria bacterium]|nr:tRNA-(ms[2]io[6]A)-hydroxylase [Gammaproteobacteria bacterium]|tara:strand:- start:740 stop:1315 length:576 start_codon:yes stop_codon:yes gene_type:complete